MKIDSIKFLLMFLSLFVTFAIILYQTLFLSILPIISPHIVNIFMLTLLFFEITFHKLSKLTVAQAL